MTVEDALSGAAGFTLASVAGGGPDDVAGFDARTPDTAGSLRAELDRAGRGGESALGGIRTTI